jgi:four helix bundle protein
VRSLSSGIGGAAVLHMAAARSHKDLICWQRAYELKLQVYELLRRGTVTQDFDFRDQLKESASSAPRLIAEGFGRYYPAEFSKYLRLANGELKETVESLDDGVDRRHFTKDQVIPLQRLAKRSSKAASRLIAYLATADAPNKLPPRRGRRRTQAEPKRTNRTE